MYVYSLLHLSSSFFTQQEGPIYELGPAHGFFLLKGSFVAPLLLVGSQAMVFCKAPRGNFDSNRHYKYGKYKMHWIELNWIESLPILPQLA